MWFLIPLRFKLFLVAALGALGTAGVLYVVTEKAVTDHGAQVAMDTANTVNLATRSELETVVKAKLAEMERLTDLLPTVGEKALLMHASSDFRSELLSLTFYEPVGNGFKTRTLSNASLISQKNLPSRTGYLLNQNQPLNLASLSRTQESSLLNRSFEYEGKSIAVHSYVLYGKKLDGDPRSTLIVADVLADSLNSRLSRSETAPSFVVTEKGNLVAHPDGAKLTQYQKSFFPTFPVDLLPSNWTQGTRFSWQHDGEDYLSVVSPLGVPGLFLCAQSRKSKAEAVMASIREELGYGVWAVLGLVVLFSQLIAWRLTRNVRNTAAAAQLLAKGEFDRIPKIIANDEFRIVRRAFRDLAESFKARLRDEFERGQKDAVLATTQTLRASMGNPKPIADSWELVHHRPLGVPSHQDFWDFYSVGNRRQIIIGTANIEGISGALLGLMLRTTLENIRRMASRYTARPPAFSEVLELLNGAVYTAFKGRVTLVATAIEIDVDTGNLSFFNCGAPTSILWKAGPKTPILDEKMFAAQSGSLGSAAGLAFRPLHATLGEGESLVTYTSVVRKNSVDDSRAAVVETLSKNGLKPLSDFKNSLVKASENRAFQNCFSFVAFRRPGKAVPVASPALAIAPEKKAA